VASFPPGNAGFAETPKRSTCVVATRAAARANFRQVALPDVPRGSVSFRTDRPSFWCSTVRVGVRVFAGQGVKACP